MKHAKFIITTTLLTLAFSVQQVQAQDFFKTNAAMCKMLGDTTFGTAALVTWEPGHKTTVHTHAAQFIYALTDGSLKIHYNDGTTTDFELKEGMSLIAPPEKPHWTENVGKKTVKIIVVEFDDHPYMEKMAKTMK